MLCDVNDDSDMQRSTGARSRSRSRSPQGQTRQAATDDVTLSSDVPRRPWFTLPSRLPVLRNPDMNPANEQLLRRYEANPFVSLTAGGLLTQPFPLAEHLITSRSAELPACTEDNQLKLRPSSTVTTSCDILPASKLHRRPADIHAPAYLDFRSRDIQPTNGLVVLSDNRRVSPV